MSLKPGSLRVQLSPRSYKVVNFVNFQNNVSENIKIKSVRLLNKELMKLVLFEEQV